MIRIIYPRLGAPELKGNFMVDCPLNIGLNTPPVGAVLFVVASIGQISMESIIKEIWPFVVCQIVTLLLVALVPWFSLLVPSLLGLY